MNPDMMISAKRDAFLSLGGKTRFRLPEYIHRRFVAFCDLKHYSRHSDALIFLLNFALIMHENHALLLWLLVRFCAEGK